MYQEADNSSKCEQLDGMKVLTSNEVLDNVQIFDSTV